MGKKQLAELIDLVYREAGQKATVLLADALRTTGYTYATKAGISVCIDDMVIPPSKETLLDEAKKEVGEIEEQYTEGLITDGERYNKVVDIWAQVAEAIAKDMMKAISTDEFKDPDGGADQEGAVVQLDLHHGGLGRPWLAAADAAARRYARPDGQAVAARSSRRRSRRTSAKASRSSSTSSRRTALARVSRIRRSRRRTRVT